MGFGASHWVHHGLHGLHGLLHRLHGLHHLLLHWLLHGLHHLLLHWLHLLLLVLSVSVTVGRLRDCAGRSSCLRLRHLHTQSDRLHFHLASAVDVASLYAFLVCLGNLSFVKLFLFFLVLCCLTPSPAASDDRDCYGDDNDQNHNTDDCFKWDLGLLFLLTLVIVANIKVALDIAIAVCTRFSN